MIKNTIIFSNVQIKLPKLMIGELKIMDKKTDNKYLNKLFKEHIYHDYNRKIKYKILDNPTKTLKHWKFIKWPITPKVIEMNLKSLSIGGTLRGRFGFEVDPCDFCHTNSENTKNVFSCPVSKTFWQDV